ncbi:MAG: hypothetical protein NUK57_02290, partial [Gudongella sp.]|nr:hypothetical protein [Gudongella sp.]
KDNLLIRSAVNIVSEKDTDDQLLDIYVYNTTNDAISLGMYGITGAGSPVSNISIIGNIYVDYVQFDETDNDIYGEGGDVFMFFHQDTHIDGSIIYNGSGNLKLKSQPNNINQLSKLISGSIYAPYANVELGDETNKVAFVIDGIIFADTIDIYSLNATQIGRFFSNSFESGSAHIPVEVGTTTNETYVTYRSYYSD